MLTGPGLVFSADADGALTAHRAFVFADTAADAAFGIDIRLLEPYLNRYRILGLRRCFKWVFAVNRQAAGCIGSDLAASPVRGPRDNTKIISAGILICNQRIGLKLDAGGIGIFDNQWMLTAHGIVQLAGKNCLGADRAIFLADDARPVHGPGQAAAAVDKGCPNYYRALLNILAQPLAFFETDGPNGSCRAKIATGDAIVLAPAGADTKIEHRCPQAFQAGRKPGRVDYIGRADAHTLAAFYTA